MRENQNSKLQIKTFLSREKKGFTLNHSHTIVCVWISKTQVTIGRGFSIEFYRDIQEKTTTDKFAFLVFFRRYTPETIEKPKYFPVAAYRIKFLMWSSMMDDELENVFDP